MGSVRLNSALDTPWRWTPQTYATGVPKTKKTRSRENIASWTWNVRTLRSAGKLEQLTHAMSRYHCNMVGLCEMHWKKLWWDVNRWQTQGLFQWRRGRTWVWGWISCAQGRSGCCLRMPASLQQTDINPPESSSFQYHHHTGLCTTICSWWQWGRPRLPATPGNHRPNTKEGHSGCTRGLKCQSLEGCTGRLGRSLWTLLHCRDKWERSQTSRVCNL